MVLGAAHLIILEVDDKLTRLELVSANDVAVFRSLDGTLSEWGASVKLKHQSLLKLGYWPHPPQILQTYFGVGSMSENNYITNKSATPKTIFIYDSIK